MKGVVVLIFSLLAGGSGYLIVTFWMNPVLRYLQIRHEVTSDLIFYANVMHETLLGDELKQRANERRVGIGNMLQKSLLVIIGFQVGIKNIFLIDVMKIP
jgi:hypothetical protein